MNELIHQNGDKLFVTSLEISNRFAKRHDNVIRDIENLECSHKFRRLNFEESSYNNSQNKAQRSYHITRDGFVFLCMGFTGEQAALWKERYIEAFNQLENALRGGGTLTPALSQREREQQLVIARENGQLRDMVTARDQIITAKDQVIMGLQDKLIGSQGKQIRLIVQVASMQKRQRDKEIIQLIETMEAEWKPREEIAKVTGKPLNYIRQRIFIARNEGRLPKSAGEQHAH